MQSLQRLLRRIEDGLLAALLLALVVLAASQVLQRWWLSDGWVGAEDATQLLVLWLATLGALAATREQRHIAIDALPRLLPALGKRVSGALGQLAAAGFCAFVAWHSLTLIELEREVPSELFAGVPSWVGLLVLPVAFGLMALRFVAAAFVVRSDANGAT